MHLQLQESNNIFICKMWLFDLFFHNSVNLICRGGDILKHFSESLGLQENERQLYPDKKQGPVVQSIVSLTSSLRVISLTFLADSIYNILIFFAEKM